MTKRALRNALMFLVAAVSASFEAPRLVHRPLGQATVELVDVPDATGDAVKRFASNVSSSHLGFDTNVYPGDKAMDAWRRSGDYEWVGYYLSAPCHKDDSWAGKRAHLVSNGWGLAVIYVGQQTWGQSYVPTTVKRLVTVSKKSTSSKRKRHVTRVMTRRTVTPVATTGDGCSASYVGAAQGKIDARDAVSQARREGFASGTVVFLDVEHMDRIPQRMRDYYRAWATAVLADGRYRPGIYAHTKNAGTIYDDVNDAYDAAGREDDPPFWIAGSGGFSPGRDPTDVGHAFASVWQGMLDVVRTHNGVRLPIDISVASVASPSFAE
jgi:Rv2525c-like, glycoside hydrolase-like domain